MLDILWLILILTSISLGIKVSKKINYKNYKIKNLTKKINFDNLSLALGSKMGVGAIVGTSMALYIGGPSTVIWMIIFTLLTSSIVYAESFLGSKYKQKKNNKYVSGPYYIAKFGLKKNTLSIVVLISFVITYSIFFLLLQSNIVSNTLEVNKKILLIITIILVTLLITNDTSEIRKTLNRVMPVITLFILSLLLISFIKNINYLPQIIKLILKDLFNIKSILISLIIGIKRSIFLNELLIGTTSMSSGINDESKETTANTLIIASYFLVFVISTLISIFLLTYKLKTNENILSYFALLKNAFIFHYGNIGNYLLNLIITLLSSSATISGIYIGTSNVEYLTNNKKLINLTKIIISLSIFTGIFINTSIVWNIIDIMMLVLITLNSYIIYKLINKLE